ncbi:MAG: SlyX family protein [Planctomycetaceae bacterium]|nr:SlyX family protein [Planctomycetaceae bacterium]
MSGIIEERLERMESAIAHLQHDIDALNESLLRHLKRMQEWDARFQKIEHELSALGEAPERRDAAAERPPHY